MPLSAKDLRKQLYEQGLPDYLQHDLDDYLRKIFLWGNLFVKDENNSDQSEIKIAQL